jgi:hypothetical protein
VGACCPTHRERGCLSRSRSALAKNLGISHRHPARHVLRVGHPRSFRFGQHARQKAQILPNLK